MRSNRPPIRTDDAQTAERGERDDDDGDDDGVRCPFCGSENSSLEQPKGSALCRTLYHCRDCDQPFELFH